MVLRALWSPVIDPHVALTERQRRIVMLRAWQTFDDERFYFAKFMMHHDRWWVRGGVGLKVRVAIWVLFLLLVVLFMIVWLSSRVGGGSVNVINPLLRGVKYASPILFVIFFIFVYVVIFGVIIQWLARPFMVEHVRRAICDLGYDEVCYRCGYRLAGLPWELVQCPECGAVRERPRLMEVGMKDELDQIVNEEEG